MDYVSIYIQFVKIRILAMFEYKKAFIWGAVAQASSWGAEFALIWIMIKQFNTINGWKPYEVMFLYALSLCSYAIASFFLSSPAFRLSAMIHSGEFDEILTKPLNPFLYLVCREFHYGYFSHLVLSIIVIVISIYNLDIDITPFKILALFLTMICAALIHAAAFIFTSVPSFWLIQNNSLMDICLRDLKSFIRYPISIYNTGIQIILTLIIPYAFINFYPAQYFLNKSDFSIFHPSFQYLTPIVGIALFILSYMFWKFGIKHYESTGS